MSDPLTDDHCLAHMSGCHVRDGSGVCPNCKQSVGPAEAPVNLRFPQVHGIEGETNEVLDLGVSMARITRTTYVNQRWTRLVVMSPPDPETNRPSQSIDIFLSDEKLALLVERLAWPK